MINQDLVNYIKSQLQKGLDKEIIKKDLLSAGWRIGDIENALQVSLGINIPAPLYNANVSKSVSYSGSGVNRGSLPGAGALLSEAWGLYRPRIKTFVGILVLQILAMIAAAIFIFVFVFAFEGLGSSVRYGFLGFIIAFLFLMVPMIIIQMWAQAAMIYAIKDSAENISAAEAYRRSWRKIGSLFWTGFISCIIIAGGFMLFVVPGIILAVWFSLASYIVISEDISGMDALLKSREYIRGKGWEVFSLFLVMFLLWITISVGAQFGLGILNMIFTAMGLGFIGLILSLFVGIAVTLITPLMTAYSYLIYKHLRGIKAGLIFLPSFGSKIKFIAVGLLGILIGVGMILLPFILFSSLSSVLGFLLPDYGRAQNRAMDASRQANIASLYPPLVMYADEHDNMYPASLYELVPEYTGAIPLDPKTKQPYEYLRLKNGEDFKLCAKLSTGIYKCMNNTGTLNSY